MRLEWVFGIALILGISQFSLAGEGQGAQVVEEPVRKCFSQDDLKQANPSIRTNCWYESKVEVNGALCTITSLAVYRTANREVLQEIARSCEITAEAPRETVENRDESTCGWHPLSSGRWLNSCTREVKEYDRNGKEIWAPWPRKPY